MRLIAFSLLLALGGLNGCITADRAAATADTLTADDAADAADSADVAEDTAQDVAEDTAQDVVEDTAQDVVEDTVQDVVEDTLVTADTVVADTAPPTDTGGPLTPADADTGGEGCGPCQGTLCAPATCDGDSCVQHPVGRAVDLAGRWVVSATTGGLSPGTRVGVAEVGTLGSWSIQQVGQANSVHAPALSNGGDWCSEQDGHVVLTDGSDGATLRGQVDLQDELVVGIDPDAAALVIAVKRALDTPELGDRYRLLGLTAASGGVLVGLSGWVSFSSEGCVTELDYATNEPSSDTVSLGLSLGNCATVAEGGAVTLVGSAPVGEAVVVGNWYGPLAPSGAVAVLHRKITSAGSTIFPGFLVLVREDHDASGLDLPGEYAIAGLDASASADALSGFITYGAQNALVEDLAVERTSHETLSGGGATATDWYQVTEGSSFTGEAMYRHNVAGADLLSSVVGQVGPVADVVDRISWLAAVVCDSDSGIDAAPAAPTLIFAVRKR